jgi:hypothetical protein
MSDKMWAADRQETKQKNGKVSSKYSSVSFDDKGNYLKTSDDDGEVTTDFKKLGVPIKSGAQLQAETDAGYRKGGKVKSASARADGCCIRGKTRA